MGQILASEMHLKTRHTVAIEAVRQSRQVLQFVVDCQDSWRTEHCYPALKIIATTAPSKSSGTSTSVRSGKASLPSFNSIAKFE